MTDLDKIFAKSDLDENKKKSKTIFGRLLIKLRQNNHIKLYSLLGNVADTDLKEGILKVIISDKTSYDMANTKHDIDVINELLATIESGITIEFGCDFKNEFDPYQFKTFLKEEFGKILTIK